MYPKYYLWKRIRDAKALIDQRYAEAIDLQMIADRVFLSKYHLIRLFKQAYGLTPRQYLISRRIERATVLLKEDLTITQVCYKVGFESLPSFSNLFKRALHMSPTAYRQEQQKEGNFR